MKYNISITQTERKGKQKKATTKRVFSREVQGGNVRDALYTAIEHAGLDGYTSGEFSIKIKDGDDGS